MQDIQESLVRLERKGHRSKWLGISLVKEAKARFYRLSLENTISQYVSSKQLLPGTEVDLCGWLKYNLMIAYPLCHRAWWEKGNVGRGASD